MPSKPKDKDTKRRSEIAARVLANPFEYVSSEEMRILLNVGGDFWDKLVANRPAPPTLARKYNPGRFFKWIEAHEEELKSVKA